MFMPLEFTFNRTYTEKNEKQITSNESKQNFSFYYPYMQAIGKHIFSNAKSFGICRKEYPSSTHLLPLPP